VLIRTLLLTLLALVAACGGKSSTPPPATAPKPATTGGVCSNDCVVQDSECHEKCLEDDAPPPEEGDSCASKCSKGLEKCFARCK
jgi:hypothetical protein